MLDFSKPCKFTFSANEIRTASECPRKRYYSSRDCLAIRENRPAKALLLGSAVHACLQYYYTELDKKIKEAGLNEPSLEDCQDLLDTIPEFKLENYEQLDKDTQKVFDLIHSMYREQVAVDLVDYEVLACELAFHMNNWPIEDVMYHGYIDMVVRNRISRKIYFFEHKTCTNFRPDIYDRFDVQLHIYAAYGKVFADENACIFGGMILNQIKKAKTERGYETKRNVFEYSEAEYASFFNWLTRKTAAIVSPNNDHAPCNNYMTCKMCEYAPICMKYGYEVPTSTEEILEGFTEVTGEDENGNAITQPMYRYDPRVEADEGGDN